MADQVAAPSGLSILFAFLGGILPALLWLWFWLQEDRAHPEPRGRIMLSFLGGMIAVALVIPLQHFTFDYFGGLNGSTIFAWAVIEEMMKYLVVAGVALHSKDFDEPLDAMEYLIITALGFAALENTLYILKSYYAANPLFPQYSLQSFITGDERFIGATLLHVVCSALIGYCLAYAFYMSKGKKMALRIIGISLAIALHAVFNLFIISNTGNSKYYMFSIVWVMVLIVLLLFEKIKRVKAQP